jgi:DNA-damage-inducible protein J
MAKTHVVRARIDNSLKQEAESVLSGIGMEMSDAIRLFLRQVVARGALPFALKASSRTAPARGARGARARGRLEARLFIQPQDARRARAAWPEVIDYDR